MTQVVPYLQKGKEARRKVFYLYRDEVTSQKVFLYKDKRSFISISIETKEARKKVFISTEKVVTLSL